LLEKAGKEEGLFNVRAKFHWKEPSSRLWVYTKCREKHSWVNIESFGSLRETITKI